MGLSDSRQECISFENKDTDYVCNNYNINDLGITGTLEWDFKTLDFESKLIGTFNLENIVLAATIAVELNITKKSISEGIKNCINIDGRLHLVENNKSCKNLKEPGMQAENDTPPPPRLAGTRRGAPQTARV